MVIPAIPLAAAAAAGAGGTAAAAGGGGLLAGLGGAAGLGSILGGAGSLAGALPGLGGGGSSGGISRKEAQLNSQFARTLATQRLTIGAQDAKRAGFHPLVAAGLSTNYSPAGGTSSTNYGVGDAIGNGLKGVGDALTASAAAKAAKANASIENVRAAEMHRAQIDNINAQTASLLRPANTVTAGNVVGATSRTQLANIRNGRRARYKTPLTEPSAERVDDDGHLLKQLTLPNGDTVHIPVGYDWDEIVSGVGIWAGNQAEREVERVSSPKNINRMIKGVQDFINRPSILERRPELFRKKNNVRLTRKPTIPRRN